jgi:hypothetical protein
MGDALTAALYPGEKLETILGWPTVYRFFASDDSKPLLVFVPGAAHNARIAYGVHTGGFQGDFLASWLVLKGYPFLALSYPLESAGEKNLMPPTAPGFRIHDWGRQAAETTKRIVNEHNLSGNVILLGWSMGGKILEPFTAAAKDLGLTVKLFISLAATPGIYGLRGTPPPVERTEAGYATYSGILDRMLHSLHEQNLSSANPSVSVIPDDMYLSDYFGHTPIGLTSWGFRYSEHDDGEGNFVADEWEAIEDSRADNFGELPFITAIHGFSPLDIRHVVADKATWGLMLTYKLLADIGRSDLDLEGGYLMMDDNWTKLIGLVHSAPSRMTSCVHGNHFFFLGERGAKETADVIDSQIQYAEDFKAEFTELLGRLKRTR